MLIPSKAINTFLNKTSLSRRVNANSQPLVNRIGGTYQAYQEG